MSFSVFTVPEIYVNCALVSYVLALLFRDELYLRLLLLLGTGFYILYYFQVIDQPLWDAIRNNVLIAVANLYVIGKIIFERSTIGMSQDEIATYAHFETLNPGLFRRLMTRARVWTATEKRLLCAEGAVLNKLYLIRSGTVVLQRAGRTTEIGPGNFIGELSFLLGEHASATVSTLPGTELVEWDSAEIRRMMRRSPEFSNAISAQFNLDIARKLSVSFPH